MNIKTILFAICAGFVMAPAAHAQGRDEVHARLSAAASGDSFKVGNTRFTLVPAARVEKKTGDDADRSTPLVGDYAITLSDTASEAALGSSAANAKFAAVMSENGAAAVATSNVKVFFDDADAVVRAARQAGGTVVYSSEAAGMASVEFASVAAALDAAERMMGTAGIRGTELQVIQGKEEKD